MEKRRLVDRTAEDAFACLGAAAAGDASADGRIADPENFGIDSVRVQRGSDLAQRSIGAAVLMRTAVYKHDFHRESLLIGFAVIPSARRAGTTAAYEQLLKYPGITEMPIVSSCYWNNVHGSRAEDIQQDEEGVRIMRVLGHNMAWLLRCIEAGKAAGVPNPRKEPLAKTNFIR